MENTYNPKPDVKEDHISLTTESLGIAEAKAKDLSGYILTPYDISDAVTKTLVKIGIPADAIRCVKVGSTDECVPKIIVELWKFMLPKFKAKDTNFSVLFDYDDDDDDNGELPKSFYAALRNKAYHGKHLEVTHVTRKHGKSKNDKKCLHFEIDPEIFIAFIYNIPFIDEYYRVKAILLNDFPKDFKNMSKSDRDEAKRIAMSFKQFGLHNCEVIVTFSTKVLIKNDEGQFEEVIGFNPDQVEMFYKDKKKKK